MQKRKSYFSTVSHENWTRDNAIKWYRREFSNKAYRAIMGFITSDLLSVIGKSRDLDEVDAAQTLLNEFRSKKSEKRARIAGNNNNNGPIHAQTYNDQRGSTNITLAKSAFVPTPVTITSSNSNGDSGSSSSSNNNAGGDPITTSGDDTGHEHDDMNDMFRDPPPSPTWSPSLYREKLFQATVLALKKGSLSLSEISKIQEFARNYKPSSAAAILDNYNAKLISSDLSELPNVMALKTTASHIMDTCSKGCWKLLKRELKGTCLLKQIIDHTVSLPSGLPSEYKVMFDNIIKDGRNENGVLRKESLDIAVAVKKLESRRSKEKVDDELLQVLDIISVIIMNFPDTQSKGEVPIPGETTFYRRVAQVLDIVVRDTSLQLVDGEQVCTASKEIIKNNKRFGINSNNNYKNNNSDKMDPYGRKIDLIVAGKKIQLATNEWKKSNCTDRVALKQQSKNVRMNKAVLKGLEQINVPKDDQKYIFSLAMDWRGNAGYLFYVSRLDDAYLAKHVDTLSIPSTLNELTTFYDTLNTLYVWKHHHQRLVNIIESALEHSGGQESVERIIATNLIEDDESGDDSDGERDPDALFRFDDDEMFEKSPNVLFTPPCRKRKVTIMVDDDTEHSNMEESDGEA